MSTHDDRVEAAEDAAYKHDFSYTPSFTWEKAEETLRSDYMASATAAIKASDQLLTNDAAIERVAKALSEAGCWCGVCDEPNYEDCRDCRDSCKQFARAAIHALLEGNPE